MSASLASSRLSAPLLRGLVFAGLLCLASCSRHLASLHLAKAKTFDFFLLVRQWPGSYCSKHPCPLLQDPGYHFTIHGLWPSYDDGSRPQFCEADTKFDERSLEDLQSELEAEWRGGAMDSDGDLWEHEWSKHGTCALSVFPNEHSYFDNVLKLHRRYDLAAALRKSAILPDKHKVYATKDLADAIYDVYGVRPIVHCDNDELSEVWMCFDQELRPFSCDLAKLSSSCEAVTIPPFAGVEPGTAELDGAAQWSATERVAVERSSGGAGQLAATDGVSGAGGSRGVAAAASDPAADGTALPRVFPGSDSSTATASGEAAEDAAGLAGPAAGGLDDMPSTGGSSVVVEDSIYWLLQSSTTELQLTSTSTSAATAAAAAAGVVSSALPIATPTSGGGSETGGAAEIETGVGGSDRVRFSDLYGDAFPIVQTDDLSDQALKQQQQLELELIEQRLMEQDEQLAAEALDSSSDPWDATGALAALAALAERAIFRLHQQMTVGGGGGRGDLINDDQTDAGGEMLVPLPNGGAAAAASGGAQDFVWASKLRSGAGEVAFSADEAEERASLGDGGAATSSGGGGAATLAVAVTDGDGESGRAMWSVQRVFVLPAGGVDAGPPMWAVLLLAVQLICLVVVTLCLVVITGMAIVGVRVAPAGQRGLTAEQGPQREEPDGDEEAAGAMCAWKQQPQQPQQPQQQQQQQQQQRGQWWVGGLKLWGARSPGKEAQLEEPLLGWCEEDEAEEEEDEVLVAAPPKIHHANRDKSAAEEEEGEEQEEEEQRRRRQQEQQQEWLVNPLRSGGAPGSVFILPAARLSGAGPQPFAPVH